MKPVLPAVPDGVDVYPRYGNGKAVYILVNFAKRDETVSLPTAMQDVLSGGIKQSVTLPRFGVAVFSASTTKP